MELQFIMQNAVSLPNENILGLTSEDSGIVIHSSLCKELDKETKKKIGSLLMERCRSKQYFRQE